MQDGSLDIVVGTAHGDIVVLSKANTKADTNAHSNANTDQIQSQSQLLGTGKANTDRGHHSQLKPGPGLGVDGDPYVVTWTRNVIYPVHDIQVAHFANPTPKPDPSAICHPDPSS